MATRHTVGLVSANQALGVGRRELGFGELAVSGSVEGGILQPTPPRLRVPLTLRAAPTIMSSMIQNVYAFAFFFTTPRATGRGRSLACR